MIEVIGIGLSIARFLVSPQFKKIIEKAFKRKKVKKEKEEALVVLQVGRPILKDVEAQIGSPDAVISVERQVSKDELHQLAAEVYKALVEVHRVSKKVRLVLSGPIVLAFLIGQTVGLNHMNLSLLWWQRGEYLEIEDMSNYRNLLF